MASSRHRVLLLYSIAALALLIFLGNRLPPVTPQNAQAGPGATSTATSTVAPPLLLPSPTPAPLPAASLTPSPTARLNASPATPSTPLPTPTPDMTALDTHLQMDTALQTALCMPDMEVNLREGQIIAPILLYHFVGRAALEWDGASTNRYNVTADDFDAQLALLHRLGYQTVTVGEIAAALRGEGALPERPIAITLDDGWIEQYSIALPLLQKYGMRATFYILSSYTRGERYVTWEQLEALRDAGMEIGSHTRTHANLTAISEEEASHEIFGSKSALEANLGITVESLAYPFGLYSDSTVALARQAGYRAAVALGPSPQQGLANLYALRRVEILGTDSLHDFINRLPWRGQGTALCPAEPADARIEESANGRIGE